MDKLQVLLIVWLGASIQAIPEWEPCKGQCVNNFKINSLKQESQILACQKGCDWLTLALITSSEVKPGKGIEDASAKQRRSNVLILRTVETERSEIDSPRERNVVVSLKTGGGHSQNDVSEDDSLPNRLFPSNQKKSNGEVKLLSGSKDLKAVTNTVVAKSGRNDTSAPSKTTIGPTSQPVQDHPSEVGKQTTTTNGPKRDGNKSVSHEEKAHKNDKLGTKLSSGGNEKAEGKEGKEKGKVKTEKESDSNKGNEGNTYMNMKDRIEQSKHTCRYQCMTAYTSAPEQEACVVGCGLQVTTLSLQETNNDLSPESQLFPKSGMFGMFRRVVVNLAGHVGKLIKIGWSWMSSRVSTPNQQGPKTIITEEKPQQDYGSESLTRNAQMPFFISLRPSFLHEQMQKRLDAIREEQNKAINLLNEEFLHKVQPFENTLMFNHRNSHIPRIISIFKKESSPHHKDKAHHRQISSEKVPKEKETPKHEKLPKLSDNFSFNGLDITALHPVPKENKRDNTDQSLQYQLDLLECISRKSGLPRWFIAITIFTSAIVVLWLCFSLTAPPDDIKVVKTKPPELETLVDDDEDYENGDIHCSEKRKLLDSVDDVINIRIENV